jgi:hypothetical protein
MKAPTMNNRMFNGTYGNVSKERMYATLAAAPIGEVVELGEFDAGTLFYGLDTINAALGASTTLSFGYKYVDGANGSAAPTEFLAAASTASAGVRSTAKRVPVEFPYPVILTATVGGAAATGRIDVIAEYVYRGIK